MTNDNSCRNEQYEEILLKFLNLKSKAGCSLEICVGNLEKERELYVLNTDGCYGSI